MLSIIIVNWNVKELLVKNLQSIFYFTKDIDYEVIVVDNGSSDGSVESIREKFKNEIASNKLRILNTKENNGFAKGNNLGYNISTGEYLVFMNPDMELVENSFKKLSNYFDNNFDVGVVGCQLIYSDNTLQKTVKNLPTFFSQVIVLLKLHHLFCFLKPINNYLQRDFDYNKKQEVEQLMGAFIMIPQEVFEKIGKWNEDYWLWWDDVDLAYQLKKNRIKIVYTPITKIVHYESKSFEQYSSLDRQRKFNAGMLIYFKKHGKKWQYFILLLLQPISLFLAWVVQVLKIKMKQQSKI